MFFVWLTLFGVAVGIRFAALQTDNLWNDEFHLVRFSTQETAGEFLKDYGSFKNNHQPLYYFFSFLWLKIFPLSKVAVRFPAFLFGALSIPLAFFSVKKHFGISIAFSVSTLVMFNFFHIRYSAEARPYSLALCLCILSLHFAYDFIKGENRERARIKLLAVNFLLYHTHVMMLPFILAEYFYLIFMKPLARPFSLRRAAREATQNISTGLFLELLFFGLLAGLRIAIVPTQLPLRQTLPLKAEDFPGLFASFSQYGYYAPFFYYFIGGTIFFILSLSHAFLKINAHESAADYYFFNLLWLLAVAAPCFLFAISWVYVPLFFAKYLSFIFIPLVMILSLLLENCKKLVRSILLAALCASSVNASFSSLSFGRHDSQYDALFNFLRKGNPEAIFFAYHGSAVISFYRKANHVPYDNLVTGRAFEKDIDKTDYSDWFYIVDNIARVYSKTGENLLESKGYFLVPATEFPKIRGFDIKKIVRPGFRADISRGIRSNDLRMKKPTEN